VSKLVPGTLALTVLLSFLTSLGPLSTDLYLPSLPAIARDFSASSGHVQLTLSAYLLGYALGLPLYGPLSDRRGRKAVLMFGLVLYGVANALSSLAPTLDILIVSRLMQGLGAAGPIVIARAIVRDLYEGRRAGQELARMGSIMGIVPAIAPLLGVVIDGAFGWRANFVASALLGGALALWAGQKLPETLKVKLDKPFTLSAIFGGFADLIADRRFLPFGLMAAATYSGLFAFISGSSFIYQNHFGLSTLGFAIAFVVMVVGFMAGSFVAQRLALAHDTLRLLTIGASLQGLGGAIMLGCVLAGFGNPWTITAPMVLYAAGVGFSLPQSMAGAMMPFPERAGAVSSLLGILQIGSAAFSGAAVGALIDRGPIVLVGAVAFFGFLALAILPLIRRAVRG
jgi:DHA1 family bicyclomycin/chloramphenicol resistance-like MFS transporter